MTDADRLVYLESVLALFADDPLDLLVASVSADGHVTLAVNCSDVFAWACADMERITPDDLPLLRLCYTRLEVVDETYLLGELYAAAKRRRSPQAPYLATLTDAAKAVFAAAADGALPNYGIGPDTIPPGEPS